jgi:hypothetical protein
MQAYQDPPQRNLSPVEEALNNFLEFCQRTSPATQITEKEPSSLEEARNQFLIMSQSL